MPASARARPRSIARPGISVAGRFYRRLLEHQHYRALGSPGSVLGPFRDGVSLVRPELDRAFLRVEQQPAGQDEEELVFLIVLVPVELALDDRYADNAVVDQAYIGEVKAMFR